jgi:hypothetical protein
MLGSWREHSTSKEQIKNIADNNSHQAQRVEGAAASECRKKLHASGCFDYDKVITSPAFFPAFFTV